MIETVAECICGKHKVGMDPIVAAVLCKECKSRIAYYPPCKYSGLCGKCLKLKKFDKHD